MSRRPIDSRDDDAVVGAGRFLELRVTEPDPGSHGLGWEYLRRPASSGAVTILAITDAQELVLVEQHRPAVRAQVIELPAGLVGDLAGEAEENTHRAAERELLEETGYAAGRMEYLMSGPTSAPLTTEMIDFYRAYDLRRVGPGGGDDTESIRVHQVPLASLRHWLDDRRRDGVLIEPRIYGTLAIAGIAF